MRIKQITTELGFNRTYDVKTRHSIADLFSAKKCCGIYILKFLDGMYYVGQAVDVVRRFAQHKKKHDNICSISFKIVSKDSLNYEEEKTIQHLERICPLKNISLASFPQISNSVLDDVISNEDQEKWQKTTKPVAIQYKRVEDQKLRAKTYNRAKKLLKDEIFNTEILPVMKRYIATCIPEPYLTELTFWGCSCFPAFQYPEITIVSRINVRFQEVFTTGFYVDYDLPFFSWHIAKSELDGSINLLADELKTFYRSDHYYPTGGKDQCNIHINTKNEALLLLENASFIRAAKTFNLRCMKKGAQPYAKYHCPALADLILPPCPKKTKQQ